MNGSTYPKKSFSQRGQGLVEYALLFGFVGAIALFIFANGGFGNSIKNAFGAANDNVAAAIGDDSDGEIPDYEATGDDNAAPSFKTLNWQEIISGVRGMYNTVLNSDTPDKALVSETNLFGQIFAMTDGHLASTNAADGIKDWQAFLENMDAMRAENNFTSSYSRGEESIAISRLGTSNTMQVRYTDGKAVVYWRISPDSNNVMQVETNSNKSYQQFFAPIVASGGWSYAK